MTFYLMQLPSQTLIIQQTES